MTRPRLVVAGLLGLAACNPPDLGSTGQPVFAPPGDPLAVPDEAAHPQIVGVRQFALGHDCTGTIVASNKVLTAAHCLDPSLGMSSIQVFLDVNSTPALQSDLLDLGDPGIFMSNSDRLSWKPVSVVLHPLHDNDQDFDVDLAVLTMDPPIPPSLITPLPVLADILPAPFIAGQTGHDKWVAYYADFIGVGNNDVTCSFGAFSPAIKFTVEIVDTSLGPNLGIELTWKDSSPAGAKTCGGDSGGPYITTVADYVGENNIPPGFVMGVLGGGNEDQGIAVGPLITGGNRTFVAQQAIDADGDGYEVGVDTCDKQWNPDQGTLDTDGDGWPDVNCDDDDDNDGVPDFTDNCDTVANPSQANLDGDASGDACDWDDDGDFVADGDDNCKTVPNPSQRNCNRDAELHGFASSSPSIVLGDACDPVPCAPADTDRREFVPNKSVFWNTSEAVCVDQYGRSYEDLVEILGRVANASAPIDTTQLEVWFCGCEAATLDACAAPPWSCKLSPTAGPALNSRWRKLSLADYFNPAVVVPQPLAATFSPQNALPPGTFYRWDYQKDYAAWIQTEHLWTPTVNSAATYGAGTDMKGVLWVEDPSSVGLSAHNAGGCTGSKCSMASSYLVDVAPDRATVITSCKDIPQLAPAPWWTYCPMCDELFRLPGDTVVDPPYVSVIGDHVRLFTQTLTATTGVPPGGATNVASLFTRELVDAMRTGQVIGASDTAVKLQGHQVRAVALSADASRLLGEVVAGSRQLQLRALSQTAGLAPRTGFAAAYSLVDGGLRVAGGVDRLGNATGDYWQWTKAAGWKRIAIDSRIAPTAASSSVFGGDRALWALDRGASPRVVRIDEATGTGGAGSLAVLDRAREAWLFVLADGAVALATTTDGRYQLSRLAWGRDGARVETSVEYAGELGGAPYATGGNLAVPLRVRSGSGGTVGITNQLVPAQQLAPRGQ